ncbi:hypothetical protein [Sorangium sp. So ce341]|uniref:hypothetical protein n=1 Tax=Sorangium sp. So ce341 TaxID=3133302 RepID=UPI003F5DF598
MSASVATASCVDVSTGWYRWMSVYYAVHRTAGPDEKPVASDIAQEIETTYRG